jgi:CMP-N-acetylneuraminic acid synthetase
MKTGEDIQTITLLEPPCPFRNGALIDEVINFHYDTGASSTVTLKPVDDEHPIRMKKVGEMGRLAPVHEDFIEPIHGLPRQKQETFYVRDTAVYVLDAERLKSRRDGLYGRDPRGLVNQSFTCNIDNHIDLLTAKSVYNAFCENQWDLQVPKHVQNKI